MSDDIKKDRLEEFFRTHLEHFEEDPGEGLFADIAANIPPKPGFWDRFRAWLLPSLGLVLLMALVFGFFQYQNVRALSSKVDVQNEQIEGLMQQLESIEENGSSGLGQNEINSANYDQQNEKVQSSILQSPGDKTHNIEATKTKTHQNSENLPNNQMRIAEKKPAENNSLLLKENQLVTLPVKEDTTEKSAPNQESEEQISPLLGLLAPIPGLEFKLLPGSLYEEKIEPLDAPISVYPHFYYSVFFEPMMMREFRKNITLVGESSIVTGYASNIGIMAGLQFNRHWSIQTGLGFRNIQAGLKDAFLQFGYSLRDPIVEDDGAITSTFLINESGLKQAELSITNQLQNDGQDIEVGDLLQTRITVPYALKYFNIPIWLRYHYKKKKIALSIKTGLVYHSLMGEKYGSTLVSISGDHPSVSRLSFKDISINIPSTQNDYLELGIGIGMEYELFSNLNIGLEPTYYRSLNPVFFNETWALGFGANVSYRFN